MMRHLDISGQAFGRLTAIRRSGTYVTPKGKKHSVWLCRCECGNEKEVRLPNLTGTRPVMSCGCYAHEVRSRIGISLGQSSWTHGHAADGETSATYRSWNSMIGRCTNHKNHAFRHYGGRGISVCQRWLESFENFLADMGEKPADKSIDRIDNDGNYEPGNCRWATAKEQANNRRPRRKVADNDAPEPPQRASRVIHSSQFEPPTYSDKRDDEIDFDDGLTDDDAE